MSDELSNEELLEAMSYSEATAEQVARFMHLLDVTTTGDLAADVRALAEKAGVDATTIVVFFQSDADFDDYLDQVDDAGFPDRDI